jgi:predicted enzyme related to lactoylglutathione lyase
MRSSTTLISGVDFVSIPTHDLAAAVEFYGSTLGLENSVHMPERHYAEFETGNVTLSVMDFQAAGMEHNRNPNAIALHVDDVADARAELQERGVSFQGETFDTGVCHMALFTDPDGNMLMLHHRYAPRAPRVSGPAPVG